MKQYLDLIEHVMDTGTRKENRTGVDTVSTFGHYYEHDLRDGFPLLTTKAVSWKNIVIEMLWFLSGQTNIDILKRHNCKFWDAWADRNGLVPSAYGNFWRRFPVHGTVNSSDHTIDGDDCCSFNDQIKWVLDEMRRNPMSRRMVVSAWAPGNAQYSKLPPCHCLFMFNVQNMFESKFDRVHAMGLGGHAKNETIEELARQVKQDEGGEPSDTHDVVQTAIEASAAEPSTDGAGKQLVADPKISRRLCLHLTQRSCDVALGVPYNIASYALLLSLFSQFTGIEPGIFGHTLVDAHIYTSKPDGSMAEFDHMPGLLEQLKREPRPLPRLHIDPSIRDLKDIEALMDPKLTTDEVMSHFVLDSYDPHPAINFKVAV